MIEASSPFSRPGTARRSTNSPIPSGSNGNGSSAALTSTVNSGTPPCRPRNAQGPSDIRIAVAASCVRNTASGFPSAFPRIRFRARQTGANNVSG